MVDDTGFPQLAEYWRATRTECLPFWGKQDNCQIAVSLSIANDAASLPSGTSRPRSQPSGDA